MIPEKMPPPARRARKDMNPVRARRHPVWRIPNGPTGHPPLRWLQETAPNAARTPKLWQLARKKARGLRNTEELKGKNIYAVHSQIGMPENAVPVRITTGTRKLKYARPMRKNVPSRLPVKAGAMQKIPLPGIPAEKAHPIKNRKILWWNFGTVCIQWTK